MITAFELNRKYRKTGLLCLSFTIFYFGLTTFMQIGVVFQFDLLAIYFGNVNNMRINFLKDKLMEKQVHLGRLGLHCLLGFLCLPVEFKGKKTKKYQISKIKMDHISLKRLLKSKTLIFYQPRKNNDQNMNVLEMHVMIESLEG